MKFAPVLSVRAHAWLPVYTWVPLSWLPATALFGSVGCGSAEFSSVTARFPFRSLTVGTGAVGLASRQIPPSLPVSRFGFEAVGVPGFELSRARAWYWLAG